MGKINRTLDEAIGEITEERVYSLLSSAFEGGINYWANLDWDSDVYRNARQKLLDSGKTDLTYEDVLVRMLFDGEKIRIVDNEDGENSEYTKDLTLENLKEGIKLDFLNSGFNYNNANVWYEADGDEADHIIQFALFGDLIFG